MSPRIHIAAAALFLAMATASPALTMNEMGASLDACFEPSSDTSELESKLIQQAWVPVAADTLTDEIVDPLAWALIVYDVNGEASADQISAARDARHQSVRDLLTGSDGSTMALTRMAGLVRETVLVTRAPDQSGDIQQACRFSLSARSVFGHAATEFAEPNVFDLGGADDPRKTTIILLNRARLNAKLETPAPISATLETVKSFPAP